MSSNDDPNALFRSFKKSWENLDPDKLVTIGETWQKILKSVNMGEGTNDLVEKYRGIKGAPLITATNAHP
eukprot:CAMPEP_0118696208 /NCGR_PEP_ID=MMETSP0800-20121206/13700_1 /TAXON_ID=210618 ORGANISM="Striatella unipunctata, Strain CCMP2910" /NCGR_SAMPLE_ID=MMETSP0800 /ASSEMBLY_ACC=CAM_ASM_000638 /LENGTH=69 /DNA_ID=CAMNT_0006595257 /DNA_START=412 /DNA_END=622 /DNA_ORIENTATION=-